MLLGIHYDSLYGAYLKAHYPMEYYTVVLNEFFDDERKTKILTNELNHFGIKLRKPQFRYSKSVYVMDKETNSIYKGIKSYKYLNEMVGEELYELRNNKYNNFIELLYDLKNTSINSRQMNVLIKLDFFREFGKTKYLLEVYNVFDSLYGKKQFSINKLPCGLTAEEISRYSNKATEKQFKEIDIKGLMNYCASKIKNEDLSIEEIFKTMKEYQGYIYRNNNRYN